MTARDPSGGRATVHLNIKHSQTDESYVTQVCAYVHIQADLNTTFSHCWCYEYHESLTIF